MRCHKIIRNGPGCLSNWANYPSVSSAPSFNTTYIVDYIVKETVGKLVEGKKPGPRGGVTKLKILDPACGSGSFLLGAYQYLLDWHRDEYVKDDPVKWAKSKNPCLYQKSSDDWRLTTNERKRILLNNIYGIDIDHQAVEVTKLSLLLKVLEGEDEETVQRQLSLFQQRALPDLGNNIKCGNSLIGSDFYEGQLNLFDDEEMYRINVFDWENEFPDIMKNSGFDAVIGNPPYGYVFSPEENAYISEAYKVIGTISDPYVAFIEKGHDILRENGYFGFIIPSAWLGGPAYNSLRNYLLQFCIETVILLPFDIFKDAYIDTVLLTTHKKSSNADHSIRAYEYPKKEKISSIDISCLPISEIGQNEWYETEDCKFVLNVGVLKILAKLRSGGVGKLGDIVSMKRGVLFDKNLLTEGKRGSKSYPYFEGNVYRYILNYRAPMCVEYGPRMREYPKEFHWFEGDRILLRRLVNRQQRLMATRIERTVITNKNLYVIKTKGKESILYLLGILNSSLLSKFYLAQVSQATKDDFPQVTIRDTLFLPCPAIDFSVSNSKTMHDKMITLVSRMLDLNKNLVKSKTPQEKSVLQRQIEATDRQIDKLVYKLYDLTDEEIEIVEGLE